MEKYKKHFRLSVEDAINYTKDFNIFDKNSKLKGEEIGDGNINYIFRIIDETNNKSVVLKQADKFLRSSGRPLDLARSKIEAEILKIQGKYSEESVPKIYHYDDIMCIIVMEDISAFKNLRKELLEEKIFPNFSDEISSFLVDTLLPTTDVVMDSGEKKDKVKNFINKELCDISECLVFTEPYDDYKKRNIILEENKQLVQEKLYGDKKLHLEVGKLKNNFMNNAQALIHGDLHLGSIFINKNGIKVIDPEFAFYGPMGYDIGNVIGNLYFPLINKKYTMDESEKKEEFLKWLSSSIEEIFDMFIFKFKSRYIKLVKKPIYHEKEFMQWYLSEILADSIGSAGLEIIRRVVGDTKVIEIEGIKNISKRILVERELLEIGIRLIKDRYNIKKGNKLFK